MMGLLGVPLKPLVILMTLNEQFFSVSDCKLSWTDISEIDHWLSGSTVSCKARILRLKECLHGRGPGGGDHRSMTIIVLKMITVQVPIQKF